MFVLWVKMMRALPADRMSCRQTMQRSLHLFCRQYTESVLTFDPRCTVCGTRRLFSVRVCICNPRFENVKKCRVTLYGFVCVRHRYCPPLC